MVDKKLVLTKQKISQRVKKLGYFISKDYKDADLMVIGILKGACVFTADLIRVIDVALSLDFIRVASYGSSSVTSGKIKVEKSTGLNIKDKDVLLVEDIVDTGQTLHFLKKNLQEWGARSVRVCALIDKKERRQIDIDIDYTGFEIQKGFLVGYGLDYAEKYRHYPDVYELLEV